MEFVTYTGADAEAAVKPQTISVISPFPMFTCWMAVPIICALTEMPTPVNMVKGKLNMGGLSGISPTCEPDCVPPIDSMVKPTSIDSVRLSDAMTPMVNPAVPSPLFRGPTRLAEQFGPGDGGAGVGSATMRHVPVTQEICWKMPEGGCGWPDEHTVTAPPVVDSVLNCQTTVRLASRAVRER